MQRRVADFGVVRHALVGIEPLVDEIQGDLVVRVRRGQDYGAGAVRQLVVDVGARLHQRPNRGDMAGPHREQQRREPADGGPPKQPRHLGIRTGGHVRTCRDQRRDGGGVTLRGGPHERRLPAVERSIDVRTVLRQHADGVDAPGARHGHQRGLPVAD